MKVDQRNIIDIKPYPKNAKEHPKKQIEKISASISASDMGNEATNNM